MATRVVHINGAGTVSPRKARAGGRKPLSDLTNAGKLPVNQADRKKALDGSLNSSKPSVSHPSKQLKPKNLVTHANPSHVRDLNLDEIAEEMGLHNHQKCIKSQSEFGAVDVHQFYKALVTDLNDGFTIYSPPKKIKFEFDIEQWELEELPEELPAMRSPVRPGTPGSSSFLSWDVDVDLDFKLKDST